MTPASSHHILFLLSTVTWLSTGLQVFWTDCMWTRSPYQGDIKLLWKSVSSHIQLHTIVFSLAVDNIDKCIIVDIYCEESSITQAITEFSEWDAH